MGGQTADHGEIVIAGEHPAKFRVTDVQKNKGGKFMHYGKMEEGTLKVGDTVTAGHRHGATEGRHAGPQRHTSAGPPPLRKVLGDHVHQAGSLVEPDRLRFDFHPL